MKKYRVTKEHPFLKEGLELVPEGDLELNAHYSENSIYTVNYYELENNPTWFEEIVEPEEISIHNAVEELIALYKAGVYLNVNRFKDYYDTIQDAIKQINEIGRQQGNEEDEIPDEFINANDCK